MVAGDWGEEAGGPQHEALSHHLVPALDEDHGIPGGLSAPQGISRGVLSPGWPWEGSRDLEVTASPFQVKEGGGRRGFLLSLQLLAHPTLSPPLSSSSSACRSLT